MTTTKRIFQQSAVGELIEVLVGRDVTARNAPAKVQVNDVKPGVIAVYRLESGALGGIAVVDLGVSCAVGAALSLIPAALAEEARNLGELPDNIRENLFEVLNVLAQVFNHSGRPRRILRELTFVPAEPVPDEVAPHLANPTEQLELELHIDGYGKGSMSLIYVEAE